MHGALIAVWKGSCDTYRGHKGIVVQETRRSFRVITPKNKSIRTSYSGLLKQNAVFLLEIGSKIVQIYGEHFQYQPAERSKLRFKQRLTPKLLQIERK